MEIGTCFYFSHDRFDDRPHSFFLRYAFLDLPRRSFNLFALKGGPAESSACCLSALENSPLLQF